VKGSMNNRAELNELTGQIIGAAIEVHRHYRKSFRFSL